MTTEVQTPWSLNEIVDLVTPDTARHVMHLSVEKGEYVTGEGRQFAPTFTLRCTTEGCHALISGLENARQVFAVISEHCTPL